MDFVKSSVENSTNIDYPIKLKNPHLERLKREEKLLELDGKDKLTIHYVLRKIHQKEDVCSGFYFIFSFKKQTNK